MGYLKETLEETMPISIYIGTVVNITKENLLHFIAYVSPFVHDAYGDGFLIHKPTENGFTKLELKTDFTDDTQKIINYLNLWSNIVEFSAEVYDTDNFYDDERIFLEGSTFYRTTARKEDKYGEYENSAESFQIFRSLCLRESVKEKSSSFTCSEKGLDLETFLTSIAGSHTLEEFKERINAVYGKALEFEHDDFYIRIVVDAQLKDTEEWLELKMFVDEEELYVDFDSTIKHFENKRVYEVNVPSSQHPQELLLAHLPENNRTEVKWDFMRDGEPLVTLLDTRHAKLFYRTDTIEIQHEQEWVSPCSLCVNRLVKEIQGCELCEFEII